MQVLKEMNIPSKLYFHSLLNVLHQISLPHFDLTKEVVEQRFEPSFNDIKNGLDYCIELYDSIKEDEEVEQEVIQKRDRPTFDSRANTVLVRLATTCEDAQEQYERWRSPRYTGRFKIDDKIDEQLLEFEEKRTRLFARDIGRLVDRLISLGYNKNHFSILSYNKDGDEIIRDYSNIVNDIMKAKGSVSCDLLSELLTMILPQLPDQIRHEEIVYVSPWMPEVANVKGQGE